MRSRAIALMIGVSAALLILVLASYLTLAFVVSRTNITQRSVLAYAPDAALIVLVGPQSGCPPLLRCPQYATVGRAIAVWWVDGPTDGQAAPLWQGIPATTQRRLVYIEVE